MSLISIIVPVYNAENSIQKCINSILSQNYKEFELIIVNDGSTDKTEEICKQLSITDKRIKIYNQHNGGVSSARNHGLKRSNGEYIVFIDSDDMVDTNYIETLMAFKNYDLVIASFKNSKLEFHLKECNYEHEDLSANINDIVNHPYLLYCVWGKLFKSSLIKQNNIYFDKELKLYEDTIFTLNYFMYCNNLKILSYKGYHYNGEWGGINKYKLTLDDVYYRCNAEQKLLCNLEKKFKNTIDTSSRCYCVDYIKDFYINYTDQFCVYIYQKYHPQISINKFLHNSFMFPSYSQISKLKELAKNGNITEVKALIKIMNHFFTLRSNELKFIRFDEKILYICIKEKYNILALLYLYLYSTLKK